MRPSRLIQPSNGGATNVTVLPREAPRLSANVRLMTICVLFCGAEPLTSFGNIRCNASGEASVMVAVEAAFRSMSFPLFTSIPALVCSPGCNAVPVMAMSSGDCQYGSSRSCCGRIFASSAAEAGCWEGSSCHVPPLSGDCRNGWPVRGLAVAVMTACVSAGIVASARDLVGGMVVVIPMEATIAAIGSITSSKDSRVRALCRSASRQPSRSAARYRLQRAPRLGLAAWGIWAERPTVALARLLRAARAIMLPFPQG